MRGLGGRGYNTRSIIIMRNPIKQKNNKTVKLLFWRSEEISFRFFGALLFNGVLERNRIGSSSIIFTIRVKYLYGHFRL